MNFKPNVHWSDRHWQEVTVHSPQPDDVVVIAQFGAQRISFPITEFNETTHKAMRFERLTGVPAEVRPVNIDGLLSLSGMTPQAFIRSLPEAFLEELRLLAIDTCSDALRYCDDRAVRTQAAAILVKLGVIK